MTSLTKVNPNAPALMAMGQQAISILSGTVFIDTRFNEGTPVAIKPGQLSPGRDYVITLTDGKVGITELTSAEIASNVVGGFHFAPGGNAEVRGGGGETPAINPHSIWDRNFRPACNDPRGMTWVEGSDGKPFWCDIYLLGKDHLEYGTSKYGATIADGEDIPQPTGDKKFDAFDYETARAVMAHHGKSLMSVTEFFAAAYGVTEKTTTARDPRTTKLDAPRTSKWGLMQATGNMWIWGHDGDPDMPRASLFGGSWLSDDGAGSRSANLGLWPADSADSLGARGRSDHLQLD